MADGATDDESPQRPVASVVAKSRSERVRFIGRACRAPTVVTGADLLSVDGLRPGVDLGKRPS